MPVSWYTNLDTLRAHGFAGFVSIRELRACKLSCVPRERGDIGVYVVLRTAVGVPRFLPTSTGGRHKGRDPSVAVDVLRAKWVPNSQIVYVGKAGSPENGETLRSRLKDYLDFGAGHPSGHWGGRYVWHLPNSGKLLVGWKRTPVQVPYDIEQRMLREFISAFGKRPFANLNGGSSAKAARRAK